MKVNPHGKFKGLLYLLGNNFYMKPLCAMLALLLQTSFLLSQDKALPEIKKGVTLTYQVSVNGQNFPIQMKLDSLSADYSRFTWSMQDGSGGTVINTKASLDNAVHGYWGELHQGEDQTMPADQSILILSKALWSAIQKDKKFRFDEQDYVVKEQPSNAVFKINDKAVNVLYAETTTGSSRVWFLNNPSLPLLLKIEGNPMGVDVSLQGVQ